MSISLKSLTCKCGLMCTSPKEINSIYDEFKTVLKISKIKNVQVIDKDTKELRDMTLDEKQNHIIQIQQTVEELRKEAQKGFEKNILTIIKTNETDHILEFEIQTEPIDAIVKKEGNTTLLLCPACENMLYMESK